MTSRGRRRAAAILPAIGIGAALLVLFTGFGPSIPGLEVREWLGLREDTSGGCEYDPSNVRSPSAPPAPAGSWRQEPLPPIARSESKAAVLDGRIYIAGGYKPRTLADVIVFDPRTRRYTRETKLPHPVDHPLFVAHDGHLYVLGGYTNSTPQRGFWRYSPGTKRWTRLTDSPVPRGAMAGEVIGGKLYVAGGAPRQFPAEQAEPPWARLDVYDIESGTWSRGPDMPAGGRHHTGYAAIGRHLYVAGGRSEGSYAVETFSRYDTRARRWEQLPPLPFGVGGLEGAAHDGHFLITGGGDDSNWENGGGFVTGATWSYDPESRRWSRLPDMETARHGLAAAVAGDRLYAFDGVTCPGFGGFKVAESLDLG